MKTAILLGVFLLAFAGQCLATFTAQYESYATVSMDGDMNIYQTVIADGTTSGDCYHPCNCGQYGCSQCPIPNCPADHTPSVYNVIGGVGGWSTGSTETMFAYTSFQSTTSIVGQEGVDYETFTQGRILCAVLASYIFDTAIIKGLFSSGKPVYLVGTSCNANILHPMAGNWGNPSNPGCALSQALDVPSGGTCVDNGKTPEGTALNCYQTNINSCVTTYCPIDRRRVDNNCTKFLSANGEVATAIPAGCH